MKTRQVAAWTCFTWLCPLFIACGDANTAQIQRTDGPGGTRSADLEKTRRMADFDHIFDEFHSVRLAMKALANKTLAEAVNPACSYVQARPGKRKFLSIEHADCRATASLGGQKFDIGIDGTEDFFVSLEDENLQAKTALKLRVLVNGRTAATYILKRELSLETGDALTADQLAGRVPVRVTANAALAAENAVDTKRLEAWKFKFEGLIRFAAVDEFSDVRAVEPGARFVLESTSPRTRAGAAAATSRAELRSESMLTIKHKCTAPHGSFSWSVKAEGGKESKGNFNAGPDGWVEPPPEGQTPPLEAQKPRPWNRCRD